MKNIIAQFALANPVGEPKPLKVGIINQSYILPSAVEGGKSYFLQKINHHIFTNVDGLQKNIQVVTDHIRERLIAEGADNVENRVLQLVKTHDGNLYYKTPEGDYWRIYVLVEGGKSEERVTPDSAYLAGRAFGIFQNQLADLPDGATCESIPNFHNLEFRMQQLHEAIAEDKAGRVGATQDIIEALLRREEEMTLAERLHREGKLPKHVSHCDTKVNNMMFDAEGKPLCIVDLDTVMPQYVLSDYGDFMRTAANTGAEDDPNLDNIHVDLDVFEAYTRGYLEEADFLTDLEKELLPYGARLFSYMQAVRFFADYLNGDTYYQIQYPEHNLVRTRAQLRLLEEQERVRPEMEAIVKALSEKKKVLILHKGQPAEVAVSCVNWPDQFPEKPEVKVQLTAKDEALELLYTVKGNDLRAVVTADHGEVWTDSCCEFFCRPQGAAGYQNYEINAIGAMTASVRTARNENVRKYLPEEMALIGRYAPLGKEPIEKEGMLEWQVGMSVPYKLISGGSMPRVVEMNLYKCGDKTPRPHFLSWAPIHTEKPDFHRPECFGLLILAD